jgi:hypothetical protein
MGASTNGKPITPWIGSWAWEIEQRRKLSALREQETTFYIHGDKRSAIERRDEADAVEKELRRHG